LTNKPGHQLNSILRLFKHETVLGWHRALVHRKWSFASQNRMEELVLPLIQALWEPAESKIGGSSPLFDS